MGKALIPILALLAAACSHQEETTADVTVRMKGLRISAPEFFKVTADDLRKLDRGSRPGAKLSGQSLSGDRRAQCGNGACEWTSSEGNALKLGRRDIEGLLAFHADARKAKKELQKQEGPVTLRCAPAGCAADLLLEDDQVHEMKTKAKVTYDVDGTGYLLQGLIRGMVLGSP